MSATATAQPVRVQFEFPVDIVKREKAPSGEFHVVGYAATSDFDLQGDRIAPEALKASIGDLIKNSTVLLNHKDDKPIGKVTKVAFDKHGLLIDVLISKTEPEIIQKIKEGVLNKFSIRGRVLDQAKQYDSKLGRVIKVIKRMLLTEASLVSVPANPEARAISHYVTKALQEASKMEDEKIFEDEESPENLKKGEGEGEKTKPEGEKEPEGKKPAESEKPAEGEKPEGEKKPEEPAKPEGEKKPEGDEAKKAEGDEAQKQQAAMERRWAMVFDIVDDLVKEGGKVGDWGRMLKALLSRIKGPTRAYPSPSPYPQPAQGKSDKAGSSNKEEDMNKEEVAALVQDAVKKALEDTPADRKGRVSVPSKETVDGLVKELTQLPPEQQLKVAISVDGRKGG